MLSRLICYKITLDYFLLSGESTITTQLSKNLETFQKIALALSKEIRLKILDLIIEKPINVNEIAERLNIPISTATVNIQKLEEAELIQTEAKPGIHGMQKICSLKYDEILLYLKAKNKAFLPESSSFIDITMPIGHYIDCKVEKPCGLASETALIGNKDDLKSFYLPDKINAQLIWAGKASVLEYHFPLIIPEGKCITSLEIVAELCSEARLYKNKFLSDISLWIDGVEFDHWTSPGDFGGTRGRYTPDYWNIHFTQFGLQTRWLITDSGTFINQQKASNKKISDINLSDRPYLSVKLGVKDNAINRNGFNLFGAKFGNFNQDLLVRIGYT